MRCPKQRVLVPCFAWQEVPDQPKRPLRHTFARTRHIVGKTGPVNANSMKQAQAKLKHSRR